MQSSAQRKYWNNPNGWREVVRFLKGNGNSDGKADILWQNASAGVAVWEMNGTSPIAAASLANPGPSWHA